MIYVKFESLTQQMYWDKVLKRFSENPTLNLTESLQLASSEFGKRLLFKPLASSLIQNHPPWYPQPI